MQGGGVKGAVYGGTIMALHDAGVLQGVKKFAGTSAGAISAALLAAGFTAEEFVVATSNTNFNTLVTPYGKMISSPLGVSVFFQHLWRGLIQAKGLNTGNPLLEMADRLLTSKLCALRVAESVKSSNASMPYHAVPKDWLEEGGRCHDLHWITFKKLFLFSKRYRSGIESHLSIAALDITDDFQLKWLNHVETPNLGVAMAMRMSASIPFVFEPVEYKGHLYVDGGLVRNLPLDAFDCTHFSDKICQKWECTDRPCAPSVLALKLGASPRGISPSDDFGFFGFAIGFLKGVLLRHLRDPVGGTLVQGSGKAHFVDFSNHSSLRGIKGTHFGISVHQKAGMVKVGYEMTQTHLQIEGCTQWPAKSSIEKRLEESRGVGEGLLPVEYKGSLWEGGSGVQLLFSSAWLEKDTNRNELLVVTTMGALLAATRGVRSIPLLLVVGVGCLSGGGLGLGAWLAVGILLVSVAYWIAGMALWATAWVRQKGLEACGVRTHECLACQRDWALSDVRGDVWTMPVPRLHAMMKAHGMTIREGDDEAADRRRCFWVWYCGNLSPWRPSTYLGCRKDLNLRDSVLLTATATAFAVAYSAVKLEGVDLLSYPSLVVDRLAYCTGGLRPWW